MPLPSREDESEIRREGGDLNSDDAEGDNNDASISNLADDGRREMVGVVGRDRASGALGSSTIDISKACCCCTSWTCCCVSVTRWTVAAVG